MQTSKVRPIGPFTPAANKEENINFAIHGEVTKRFLESNNFAYEEASSEPKSLQLSEVARRAQEYTGILICM